MTRTPHLRPPHRSLVVAAFAAVAGLVVGGCIADDPDSAPPRTSNGSSGTTATTAPGRTDDPAGDDPAGDDPTGDDPTATTGPRGSFGPSRLSFFGDCPGLLGYLQAESLERVTAWGLGGDPYWRGGPMPMLDDMAGGVMAPEATMAASEEMAPPTGADGGYSTTNTQEVGVDEGDIVETNGTHVFVAAQDGVRIVEVDDAQVVEQLELPEGSHQLLLDGPRLLVITSTSRSSDETVVSLFDVADPSDPVLVRRSHLEGRIVAARAIDGTARLVLTTALATRLPFVYPDQFGLDEDRALEENQRVIRESAIDDWMPRWFDENGDGSFTDLRTALDCSTVAAPRDFAGLGISWIASVDLAAGTSPVGAAGVVSSGDTVYASQGNVYLATQSWDWWSGDRGGEMADEQPPTLIHQFALGAGGAATWVGSGEVPGRLLNQFAMGEYQGDLRVASTIDDWGFGAESESVVTVLRPDGAGALAPVGEVRGLGVTEQIYAVRFMGPQAYVVTFRQTDPLYVVDLSDPTNPRVTGELKIPGYSAYLHPVGDGLLLGVGQDADLDGRTLGTQLSLFDVRDPANPQRLSTLTIGGSSEAEWDHRAFLYWPEDGTIVIPSSPWWGACGPAVDCLAEAFTSGSGGGVVVAQLQGSELVGRGVIEHRARNGSGCWNPLNRSMIIGSEIVTIGLDQMQFTDRATLEPRDAVRWGDPEQYGCYYWTE